MTRQFGLQLAGRLTVAALLLSRTADCQAAVAVDEQLLHDQALAALQAGLDKGREFVRVHAAEYLIWNGHPAGVAPIFTEEMKTAGPNYRIGVWRIFAYLAEKDQNQRAVYLDKIRAAAVDPHSPDRLNATETLAKLGFRERPGAIVASAAEGPDGIRGMARWVLANSGEQADEAYLAELLESPVRDERLFTAYALRWLKKVRPESLDALRKALATEPADSLVRPYLLSAIFVHTTGSQRANCKRELQAYVSSNDDDAKKEFCAALASRGSNNDLTVLRQLLKDPDLDVQVNAGHAILQILSRPKPARVGTEP
ncbi:hypothetical protein OAS39_03655 [Pirellulales bacterium]|nr:hypothetical protein [Pirellulales bacterium]